MRAIVRNRQAGFTLLELMVAITVLGLLMGLLYANLKAGTQAWLRSESHFFGSNEVRYAQAALRRLLGTAYPSRNKGNIVDFAGTENSIGFLAPASVNDTGRSRIAIGLAGEGAKSELIMSAVPELARAGAVNPSTTILLRNIRSASFAYFGRDAPDAPPSWRREWINRRSLPKLIRMELQFDDTDTRMWPVLIVAPRITADTACQFDITSGECRSQ
ncbi:MAG: prepilin-type N-terminal cleavage/methylation domain-containing protein [Bdellovibrionales bacterium]